MLELWSATTKLGFLPAASSSVRVREVINGEYFTFFDYPKIPNDIRYDLIVTGKEIRFPSSVENGQRYIIQSVDEVQQDNKIFKSIEAMHVSLSLGRYFYDGYIDFAAAQDLEDMLSILSTDTPFTFAIEGSFSAKDIFDWGEDSKLALLHKLRDLYGAELSFDNYEITLTTRKGANNGKQIRRRKNMKGIKCMVREQDRVTRLYGYGKDGLTIEGYSGHSEKYIDSTHYDSSRPFTAKMEWPDIETQSKLLAEMQKYLASTELPKVSYDVETVRLGPVEIGDTITVLDDVLGYSFDARLREYERWPFNQTVRPRLTLGNFRPMKISDYIFQATVGSKKAIAYTSRNAVLKGVKYDDSITLVDGLGLKVTDDNNDEQVRLGQIGPGIYGLWVASGAIQVGGGLPDSQILSSGAWNAKETPSAAQAKADAAQAAAEIYAGIQATSAQAAAQAASIPIVNKQFWDDRTTLITASGVYTGTVLANQVVAATLSAISANLGTITAGSISGIFISGTIIDGGTITGSLIQNQSAAGNKVYTNSTGFHANDASGVERVTIGTTPSQGAKAIITRDSLGVAQGVYTYDTSLTVYDGTLTGQFITSHGCYFVFDTGGDVRIRNSDQSGFRIVGDNRPEMCIGSGSWNGIGFKYEIDGKANIVHAHTQSDISGLAAALDGKSPTSHNHDSLYGASLVYSSTTKVLKLFAPNGTHLSSVTLT